MSRTAYRPFMTLLLAFERAAARIRIRHHRRARLEERLQVRQDLRPATRHGVDEFRRVALDGVRDAEPHDGTDRLELVRTTRLALGLDLGLALMLPADHEPPRRVGFDDAAVIEQLAVGSEH